MNRTIIDGKVIDLDHYKMCREVFHLQHQEALWLSVIDEVVDLGDQQKHHLS